MRSLTPYQRKFIFLVLGYTVCLVLGYHLSLKKSAAAFYQHRRLQEKMAEAEGLEKEIHRLQALEKSVDDALGPRSFLGGFQENLLHETGSFCGAHDIRLEDFSEPVTGMDGDYKIETIRIRLQGEFKPLLKLAHHLGHEFDEGRIASVRFVKERNYRTLADELFLELYMQKITENEEERS